jgi:hypothetical protein
MRKLRLDPHALAVQSFQTLAPQGAAGGTVHGGQAAPDKTYQVGCPSFDCVTHPYSCNGTCAGETCYDSCNLTCHTCQTACFGTCEASCGGTCPACALPTQPGYVCEPTV